MAAGRTTTAVAAAHAAGVLGRPDHLEEFGLVDRDQRLGAYELVEPDEVGLGGVAELLGFDAVRLLFERGRFDAERQREQK